MFGRSVKTTTSTRVRKPPAATRACPRCRQSVRASAPRCPGCGNRLFFEPAPEASPKREPLPPYDLTEIQRRILGAAHDGGPIFVYRLPGPQEGEVKSGSERFFGDEAVAAVATLIAPGLVAAIGEDRFELTRTGLRLAASLI